MADAITITDLENAKLDADHIADIATSQLDTATDRLGTSKNTLQGALKTLGFIPPVAYAAAISFTVSDNTKTVDEAGVIYAPLPSALPFTTSGTFIGDDDARFFVIQGITTGNLVQYTNVKASSTVAMIADTALQSGAVVTTEGYSVSNDGGGGTYLIRTLGEFGATPDEIIDLTLSNGNVAILQDQIGVNLSVSVPSNYSDISSAFSRISSLRISNNATFTITVADGLYNLTAGMTLNHIDGERVNVVGNQTTPSNVELRFPNAFGNVDAIAVTNGHNLGLLDGFKISKVAKADNTDVGTAVLAVNGATIICGQNIVTDNWYYGIAARNGSYILCDGAAVDNAGDVGIWSFVGSTVQCRNAQSNNAIDGASLGFGFQAEYGSAMDCEGSSATGNKIAGFAALSNSNVRALSVTSNGNVGSGLFARDGSTIEAHNATANTNTRYGVEEIADGRVYGTGITASANTIADFSDSVSFDNGSGLGSRIVSRGPLRIDNGGADGIFFNTSGGNQVEIAHAASAVNRLVLNGSATGVPVDVKALGSDANVDLRLSPKGAGQVRWGVHTAGSVTPNGYVEWKLDDGATVRVDAQRI